MMYMMYNHSAHANMVRKQLYITIDQDRALKLYARQKGLSEAEVVREALDRHLSADYSNVNLLVRHQDAVAELIEGNRRLSEQLLSEKGFTFNREDIYRDREQRWLKNNHTD